MQVIDSTLREGEQSYGVLFSISQKQKIIDGLVRVGIREIELGVGAPLCDDSQDLLSYCRTRYPHLRTSFWARCRAQDIDHVAQIGGDYISLSLPVSDLLLEFRIGKGRQWAESAACQAIRAARGKGLSVAIGFEDALRADRDFVLALAQQVEAAGAYRIRLADTVGTASPRQMMAMVRAVKDRLQRAELAVHCHNDFGMATANSIAALEAGAQLVDATVLGLGERSGCARLEEVIGYLGLIRGVSGFFPEQLTRLAHYVGRVAGRPVAGWTPVVGEEIFACESGLHVQALLQDPSTYEPFAPERVGATRKLGFGAKSGQGDIERIMEEGGELKINQVRQVRELARRLRRPLSRSEVLSVLGDKTVVSGPPLTD